MDIVRRLKEVFGEENVKVHFVEVFGDTFVTVILPDGEEEQFAINAYGDIPSEDIEDMHEDVWEVVSSCL
ncbi:hypothetical protein [Thermus phage P23-45]|uniref:Uncharacterized protein n=1 Tax=Thermus virus P23-45 TaxID=2914006 RepID=A7XX97_BP234|nr:hypothetical protein P23p67 [Thermus phage P23-45]ABU96900.1 hypothetical protein P23p67 [Thermus phage P23-45]UYB98407.1 hypothetical protein [Thermus phage P23-45]